MATHLPDEREIVSFTQGGVEVDDGRGGAGSATLVARRNELRGNGGGAWSLPAEAGERVTCEAHVESTFRTSLMAYKAFLNRTSSSADLAPCGREQKSHRTPTVPCSPYSLALSRHAIRMGRMRRSVSPCLSG